MMLQRQAQVVMMFQYKTTYHLYLIVIKRIPLHGRHIHRFCSVLVWFDKNDILNIVICC